MVFLRIPLKQKPVIRCSFQKPRPNPFPGQQAPWRPSQVAGCDCHTTRNALALLCQQACRVKRENGSRRFTLVQIEVNWTVLSGSCCADSGNHTIPAGRRLRFESPVLHSTGVHTRTRPQTPARQGYCYARPIRIAAPCEAKRPVADPLLTPFWHTLPHRLSREEGSRSGKLHA